MTAYEQTSMNQIERDCLAEMNWELSRLDICSDAEKYKLILNIEKSGLDYNTKLAPDQHPPSPQYLPLQEAQMIAAESSEERPDDMSLEEASITKRRGRTI